MVPSMYISLPFLKGYLDYNDYHYQTDRYSDEEFDDTDRHRFLLLWMKFIEFRAYFKPKTETEKQQEGEYITQLRKDAEKALSKDPDTYSSEKPSLGPFLCKTLIYHIGLSGSVHLWCRGCVITGCASLIAGSCLYLVS